MGRKRQADVPVPEQRPPATVDDHDGQHDADKDGVEDDDEEQDVRLARSVTTSLPRLRRSKKSGRVERRKSVSPGSHRAITVGGVYSQKRRSS